MLAKVNSAALYGIDALRVEVEIDLASGLPQLATVGSSHCSGPTFGCQCILIVKFDRSTYETEIKSLSG